MPKSSPATARTRAMAGAWRGLQWGAVLSLYVSVMYVVGKGRALHALGTSLPVMIAAYLVGGGLAGATLGALRPLRRVWWGRLVSGVAAGTAGGLALMVALAPSSRVAVMVVSAVLFGLVVGGPSALLWLRR